MRQGPFWDNLFVTFLSFWWIPEKQKIHHYSKIIVIILRNDLALELKRLHATRPRSSTIKFSTFHVFGGRGVENQRIIENLEIIWNHFGHVGEASKLVSKHVGPPRNHFKPSPNYQRKPSKSSLKWSSWHLNLSICHAGACLPRRAATPQAAQIILNINDS